MTLPDSMTQECLKVVEECISKSLLSSKSVHQKTFVTGYDLALLSEY